jgi:hypothetical protein
MERGQRWEEILDFGWGSVSNFMIPQLGYGLPRDDEVR